MQLSDNELVNAVRSSDGTFASICAQLNVNPNGERARPIDRGLQRVKRRGLVTFNEDAKRRWRVVQQ